MGRLMKRTWSWMYPCSFVPPAMLAGDLSYKAWHSVLPSARLALTGRGLLVKKMVLAGSALSSGRGTAVICVQLLRGPHSMCISHTPPLSICIEAALM